MNNDQNKIRLFRYNMSFYYQSTIIYLAVFVLYIIIRGEFVEDSFTLITKDPIIYFFALIIVISIISLLYNLYKNKHLEVSDKGIAFINRKKERRFNTDRIESIKIGSVRKTRRDVFRFVKIKIKGRKRLVFIRPYHYENEQELMQSLVQLKESLEKDNV